MPRPTTQPVDYYRKPVQGHTTRKKRKASKIGELGIIVSCAFALLMAVLFFITLFSVMDMTASRIEPIPDVSELFND